jgi:hypothetical protein
MPRQVGVGYGLPTLAPQHLRIRLATCAAAVLLATVATLLSLAIADARPTRTCKSADLRYPFNPGGPKDFGVFKLRITGGKCTTAHRVAKAWMRAFEARLRGPGRLRLPRSVAGFRFTTLPPNAAQTYRERGRRRTTTIRFDYRVPNG